MPFYRVQVAVERGNDLDIDDCVNTFYLNDIGVTTDAAQLALDAAQLWASFRQYPTGVTRITAKIYDMADAQPRLPKAERTAAVSGGPGTPGPGEVALCLSYYAGTNQPRRRGRMYIGPFSQNLLNQRPSGGVMQEINALATGIANLGGIDVDWVQYSPTNNQSLPVTAGWVDNEWDTVRSRGLQGTSRVTFTTNEA